MMPDVTNTDATLLQNFCSFSEKKHRQKQMLFMHELFAGLAKNSSNKNKLGTSSVTRHRNTPVQMRHQLRCPHGKLDIGDFEPTTDPHTICGTDAYRADAYNTGTKTHHCFQLTLFEHF